MPDQGKGREEQGGSNPKRTTYRKLVKLAKGLQPRISPLLCPSSRTNSRRGRSRPARARRELIRHNARQHVLPKLLNLMMHRGLKRIASDEAERWPAHLSKEHLARRSLHLDAQADAVDHRRRLVVHRERARERLAELDRAE